MKIPILRTISRAWKKDWTVRITVTFFLICTAWILLSDTLLLGLVDDVRQMTRLQVLKGWIFILATSALLFYLLRSTTRAEKDFLTQLQASESRLGDLVFSMGDWVWELDRDGVLTFCSPSVKNLLGYSPEELVGTSVFDLMDPAEAEDAEASYRALVSSGGARRDEKMSFVHRDGHKVVLLSNGIAVHDADGAVKGYRGVDRNITEFLQAHEEVRQQKEVLQSLLDGLPVMVDLIDGEGNVHYVNRAWEKTLGMSLEEAKAQDFLSLFLPDSESANEARAFIAAGEGTWKDFRVRLRDGRTLETTWANILLPSGGIIGIGQDISERKRAEDELREKEERLHFLAHHDVLTRLPNRLLFQDRMQHALAKARRTGDQVALIYLDLDRFKTINDSLGHAVGDRVLKEIASRLDRNVRESDTVARLGGDEFVIILEQVRDIETIAVIVQKFLLELGREIVIDDNRLFVTASAGISLFPDDEFDAEGLLKSSETAMYRAKERGKNTYQFFTQDMNARARELLLLEGGLRQALEEEEFVLFYQPQIDLKTGDLIGMEALLRWQHPERGMVPPGDFIPLAEETGLIVPIGDWVLRTACCQLQSWVEQGFPRVRMAVNISPRQFRQTDLSDRIADALSEAGLDADLLELEVTEGMIMNDVEAAIETMQELRRMGVHLAIDDFGTGYSSLAYLKRFPIAGLKIDRSFVRDVTTDPNDAQIAASVIALAHSMKLRVVAEGIETEPQLSFLKSHRCDQGQGFLFSPPCPAADFEDLFLVRGGDAESAR